MSKVEKIRDDLYIKKGWDGYRVVFPIKKDPSGPWKKDNIHWSNLLYGGHWSRPIKALLFILALYLFVQAYLSDTKTCRDFVANIGTVCSQYNQNIILQQNNTVSLGINLTKFNQSSSKPS